MKTVAGIDLGTQSMKVVIYDYEKKEIIEKASCPMELISKADGTREQNPEDGSDETHHGGQNE